MNANLKLFAAAAMTVGTMSIGWAQNAAPASENQVQNAAERAGDRANRAADKTGNAADKAADRTGDAAQKAADRTGATIDKAAAGQGVHGTAEAPDAEGIRDVLASSTEAAIKGSFSDVVERFVDADRNRIGRAMPSDNELKPLNDLVSQFKQDWKAKYNQDFDIEKEELVFNPSVRIIQGEFGDSADSARTAGERSDAGKASDGDRAILGNSDIQTLPDKKGPKGGVDLTDAADQDRANRAAGGNVSGQQASDAGSDTAVGRAADRAGDAVGNAADRARQAAGSENRERGRNMATATIPASHGLPGINVPLIHELPDNWRIDVPDTVDAATLQANLQKHLGKAHAMKAQWPADANEGYLVVAHHVLLALFEGSPAVQKEGAGADAQPAAGTVAPSAAPAGGATATPAPATPAPATPAPAPAAPGASQ